MPSQESYNSLQVRPEQFGQLIDYQGKILTAVVVSSDVQENLDSICTLAEGLVGDALASIMLFDEIRQSLYVRAAPSIPEEGQQALNGLEPGPFNGSCGNAVYSHKPCYVSNTLVDARWKNLQTLAKNFGITACWSNPIFNSNGEVIGSFAISSFEEREPSEFHKMLLANSAKIIEIILERQHHQEQLWESIHQDPLTRLPNRKLLNLKLKEAINTSIRYKHHIALLFIDLDDFKKINDRQGHETGDKALLKLSKRLSSCIRETDTLARVGGDEFILLIDPVDTPLSLWNVARKILSLFKTPITVNEQECPLVASIGISIFPKDGMTINELIQHADMAMYSAKRSGGNSAVFYEEALTKTIESRYQFEEALHKALKNDEFEMYYQPVFKGDESNLIGLEALLRWNDPIHGVQLPSKIISIAEETNLIYAIGDWVLESVAKQARIWLGRLDRIPLLSINISPRQLVSGFADKFCEILEKYNLPPGFFELEVTENVFLDKDLKYVAIRELEKIRSLGISITLDDFGTGYSSLAQLRALPINKLKIDRSFIMDIPGDEDDTIITKSIIQLAQNLHLTVLAEGVETLEQKNFLIENGCDLLQGFLLSKPMSVFDIDRKFLQSR